MKFYKTALIRQIAGWTLIAIGAAGLILPVLPGWPFLGAGALLLAPHVRLVRRLRTWKAHSGKSASLIMGSGHGHKAGHRKKLRDGQGA